MTSIYTYKIKKDNNADFHNNAIYCIGTGRMNLALRQEYHDQLKIVQEDIHFSHIRGHGLFCDDMAIYHKYEEDGVEKAEYNFTYVDMVFDDYQSMGLKPFVELGFMPEKLASGSQTVFYWKGNVTPPKDYSKWADLVTATVNHWIDRYGRDEVITWPFEVWNEPNLPGFWKGADMEEYFKLYDITGKALKSCDSRIRVGGPAICGVDDERWLRCFLDFCTKNKAPLDFVTRHAYATEMPEKSGHYDYQKLRTPEVFMAELTESRRIIDSFPEYVGMEMHITEFNTSYTPLNPIHDTNLNAAYVARLLSEMGDVCASYSYWTFSFFHDLGSDAIARSEHFVLTKDGRSNIRGIAWNPAEEGDFAITLNFSMDLENGEYMLVTKLVDEETCNPLKTWINMGSPSNPAKDQLELIRECARPLIRTKRFEVTGNVADLQIPLSSNSVCYFEIQRIYPQVDRGYHPERIRGAR